MKLVSLFILIFCFSCMSSLHLFNQADPINIQEYSKAKKIKSEATQFTFLGFVKNTNYVEEAIKSLVAECPNGSIEQIGTSFKTKLGFFSWTNQINLTGYCLEK